MSDSNDPGVFDVYISVPSDAPGESSFLCTASDDDIAGIISCVKTWGIRGKANVVKSEFDFGAAAYFLITVE